MLTITTSTLFPPALPEPIGFEDIDEGDLIYVTVTAPQYQSVTVGVAHLFGDGACEDAGGRILATASYARAEDEVVSIFRVGTSDPDRLRADPIRPA